MKSVVALLLMIVSCAFIAVAESPPGNVFPQKECFVMPAADFSVLVQVAPSVEGYSYLVVLSDDIGQIVSTSTSVPVWANYSWSDVAPIEVSIAPGPDLYLCSLRQCDITAPSISITDSFIPTVVTNILRWPPGDYSNRSMSLYSVNFLPSPFA